MTHYTRIRRGGNYRHYAFLICEACYLALSSADQSVYALCQKECGTLAGCERCQEEEPA